MNALKDMVDDIIADGKITHAELYKFNQAVQADGTVDRDENEQVNRILGLIEAGKLKVV